MQVLAALADGHRGEVDLIDRLRDRLQAGDGPLGLQVSTVGKHEYNAKGCVLFCSANLFRLNMQNTELACFNLPVGEHVPGEDGGAGQGEGYQDRPEQSGANR